MQDTEIIFCELEVFYLENRCNRFSHKVFLFSFLLLETAFLVIENFYGVSILAYYVIIRTKENIHVFSLLYKKRYW